MSTILPPIAVSFLMILANASPDVPGWMGAAGNAIGLGSVLFWFMFRAEPRLREIEAALNRNARTQMVMLLSIPTLSEAARKEADAIIKEIDAETAARQAGK